MAQSSLRGTVIDGDDNTPLVGATVTISNLHRSNRTDDHGRWIFKNVAPGKHFVVIHAVGHKMFHDTLSTDSASTVVLLGEDIHQQDLVVSASPDEAPRAAARSDAEHVITGLDLDRVRATSVAQTLTVEPGIAMRTNGGAATRPVMRGLGDNRVTILENGLPGGDLSGSAPDHAVAIDPNAAERIEILRGAPALQYANNALTGVINVSEDDIPTETVENSTRSVYLDGASGSKAMGAGVTLAQSIGRVAVRGQGNWRVSDDVRTPGGPLINTDTRSSNGTAGIAYITDDLTAGASFRVFSERYGIPVPTDTEPRSIITPLREQVHVASTWKIGEGSLRDLAVAGNYTWYAHDERDRARDQLLTSFALHTLNATARMQHAPIVDGGNGAVGASLSTQQYAVSGEEKLTPNGAFSNVALYAYEQIPVGVTQVQAAARFESSGMTIDRDSALGFVSDRSLRWSGVFGSVGATVPIATQWAVTANLSQSFRAPSMEELAANNVHGPTRSFDIGALAQSAARELSAERGIGGDIAVRFHTERVHGEVTVYDNLIGSFIYRAFRGDSVEGMPVYEYRQSDANLVGMEVKAEGDLGAGLFATVLADLVRGTRSDDQSPLPQMPPARASVGLRYSGDLFWCGGDVRGTFRQTRVSPEEIRLAANEAGAQTAGNVILNLNAGIRFILGSTVHTLSLRIDNALDQSYRDHLSVSKWFAAQPGIDIGVRYTIIL